MGSSALAGERQRPAVARHALAAAAGLTVFNAVKPLHIDDPFSHAIARRIVDSPFDPYGFEIFWLQWPQPVYEELTPPVVPYWWALGLAIGPAAVWFWKLWFFPFAWILCRSVGALAQRLAPRAAIGLVWAVAVAPPVLAGFNLMQGVPALALGLAAVALFLRACDRGSGSLAAVAGVVAGLATQTKYTAVGVWGAILLWALLRRRPREGGIALGVAAALFVGWEAYTTWRYGSGMLEGQLGQSLFWVPRERMIEPLVRLIGSAAPFLAVAGLATLRRGRGLAVVASIVVVLVHLALFRIDLTEAWGWVSGITVLAAVGAAAFDGVRDARRRGDPVGVDVWLAAWWVGEVVLFFGTAQFPAVRRVIPLLAVSALVLARRWQRAPGDRVTARAMLAAAAAVGLLVATVDVGAARDQRDGARWAASRCAEISEVGWFVGHWGFQYYAGQAGLRPIVPDTTVLSPGDCVVLVDGVHRQDVRPGSMVPVDRRVFRPGNGFETGQGFYGGMAALSHRTHPRLTVSVWRVTGTPRVAESAWGVAELANWAARARGRTAAAAGPALARRLGSPAVEDRRLAAAGLAALGARAAPWQRELQRALTQRDGTVRALALRALGQVPGALDRPRLTELAADADPGVAAEARRLLDGGRAVDSP